MNRPSFQFYPSDWLTEPGLRMCSVEARGLWIDLLCLAHKGNPYGHVTLGNGRPPTDEEIARFVGCPKDRIGALLSELESYNILSRTKEKVIYSRRMVNDELKRENWRQWYQGDKGLFRRIRRVVGGSFSEKNLETMLNGQSFRCYYCGKKLPKRPVLDHKIPIVKGGTHELSNLAFSCKKCNAEKSTRTEDEYRQWLREYGKGGGPTRIQTDSKRRSKSRPGRSSSSSSSSLSSSDHPKKDDLSKKSSGGAASWRATSVSWDDYREGVSWDDGRQEVALSDEARAGLREHLEAVATEEGLRMLTKEQLQEGWGRLSTHLVAESRKRGKKTLPSIVRGWLSNDLRRFGRGPPGKAVSEPKGFEAIRRRREERKRRELADGDER